MSPDKSHSHQRVETSRPGLAENVVSACREKVRGMRGISAAALLAVVAAMGCQPAHHVKKCKTPAACAKDNTKTPGDTTPTNTSTPTDTTKPTDPVDPTCPPTCPVVPDTTKPKTPLFAIGATSVTVGPSTAFYSADVTIPDNPDANMKEIRFQVDSNAPTIIPYTGQTSITVDIPAGTTGTVILADKAGNTSSASLRVNVDAIDPGAPAFSIAGPVTVGPSVSSIPVVLTLPTPLDTETVEIKIDNGAWTPAAYTPKASTLNLDIAAGHTTYARAKDKVGNISAESSLTVNIDNQGPLTPYPATATQITLGPTEFSTPVTFTIPQPAETQKILASIDGGAFAEVTSYTAGNASVVIPVNKGSSVKIEALDSFNNPSAQSAQVSVLAEAVPASPQVSQNYFALNASAPTFSFDVTLPSSINHLKIVDAQSNIIYDQDVTPPNVSLTFPNPTTNQTYTIYDRAPKGTWSLGTDVNVEYDNIAPAAPVITTNGGSNFGVFQPNFTTEGTCNGLDTAKMQVRIVRHDGGGNLIGISEWADILGYIPGSNNWSVNGVISSSEYDDYYFRAVDSAGNISATNQIQVIGAF